MMNQTLTSGGTISIVGYGDGGTWLRGGVWWIYFSHHGKRVRESARTEDRAAAERLLLTRRLEIAEGRYLGNPGQAKVSDLLALVVTDYESAKKRSLPQLLTRVEKHLKPGLGSVLCADFRKHHAESYRRDRYAAGASVATINRELEILRRAFRLGTEEEPPLVARTPKIAMDAEDNAREGFVEHDQYLALREELPPYLRLMASIGYHVGLRAGMIRRLQWSWVDFGRKRISIPKRGRNRGNKRNPAAVPFIGDMEALLSQAKAERDHRHPDNRFVVSVAGRKVNDSITSGKGWRAAVRRAGLDGLIFHDLRRSAVKNMVDAGVPIDRAKQISGHKSNAMFERYDILGGKSFERTAEQMREFDQRRDEETRSGVVQ